MPLWLDETDIALLKSLQADGRKSFRQIAREIGSSTPTVKKRFDRLVGVGLIKSVSPVLDLGKIEDAALESELVRPSRVVSKVNAKKGAIGSGSKIKLECDYCHGEISGKPVILSFADQERYLCCNTCRKAYQEKFKGRIASLSSQYSKMAEK